MNLILLKSKIHNATITDKKIEYEGSITIDSEILEKAKILPYEKVLVVDITNGERFETYIIQGKRGSKEFCVNGAAARLVEIGDKIIVMAFGIFSEEEAKNYKPIIIKMS
jgi:aspartate 1-decarboxylase